MRTQIALALLALVAGCAPPRHQRVTERQETRTTPPPPPQQVSETKTTTTQTAQAARTNQAGRVAKDEVQRDINGWSTASHAAADDMIAQYGMPDEAAPSMLVWYNNGDWKRTIVHRDAYSHNFPRPHQDVLEQVVDYRVPADKLADLDRFDGSLSFSRTRGELTSWGQNEQQNLASINLADDIVQGRLTADDARQSMNRSSALGEAGKTVTNKANWKRSGASADPDSSIDQSNQQMNDQMNDVNENGAPAWP